MRKKNSPHTIACYHSRTGPKLAALLLATLAGLLLGLLVLRPASSAQAAGPVQQLPRVEISGKSQNSNPGVVQQLPRVVIEGRSLQGQRLAQAGRGE